MLGELYFRAVRKAKNGISPANEKILRKMFRRRSFNTSCNHWAFKSIVGAVLYILLPDIYAP